LVEPFFSVHVIFYSFRSIKTNELLMMEYKQLFKFNILESLVKTNVFNYKLVKELKIWRFSLDLIKINCSILKNWSVEDICNVDW